MLLPQYIKQTEGDIVFLFYSCWNWESVKTIGNMLHRSQVAVQGRTTDFMDSQNLGFFFLEMRSPVALPGWPRTSYTAGVSFCCDPPALGFPGKDITPS